MCGWEQVDVSFIKLWNTSASFFSYDPLSPSKCFLTRTLACYIVLSRLDRRTQWEIRQWHSQTEEDEQEEHRGRAQSASVDINQQWQVRVCQQRLWSRKVPAAQPRSACVPQVSLRVCRQRSGRPAALLVQLGGGARGGRAAARESASRQRVCRPRILRGRHPGPKVKTIPPCTALSTHSCTVTILFKGVFWGLFCFQFVYWITVLFIFI